MPRTLQAQAQGSSDKTSTGLTDEERSGPTTDQDDLGVDGSEMETGTDIYDSLECNRKWTPMKQMQARKKVEGQRLLHL